MCPLAIGVADVRVGRLATAVLLGLLLSVAAGLRRLLLSGVGGVVGGVGGGVVGLLVLALVLLLLLGILLGVLLGRGGHGGRVGRGRRRALVLVGHHVCQAPSSAPCRGN